MHGKFTSIDLKNINIKSYTIMKNIIELDNQELIQINGGGIIPIIMYAFGYGVAYGYVKEKLQSGQW